MKKIIIIASISVFLFASCKYQKLLKSGDTELKLQKAYEYYEEEDYVRSIGLFEDILALIKGTDPAEKAFYTHANSHYLQEDYILAGYYFRNFAKTYPTSEYTQEAQYLSAFCYYQDSPRPSLDQENTRKAISEFQLFISLYPTSNLVNNCDSLIDQLRGKLEEKSFNNAKLYFDLGDYKAARISLKNSLKEYPDSKNREELMYYAVKANFLYADNSVKGKQKERYEKTLDEAYNFLNEFKESKMAQEVEKIQEKTQKALKDFTEE